MAQTKHQIQDLLNEAASRPRRQFGQNFMIDQNLVRLVAAAGDLQAGDLVIEVGPGTGTLTEELLAIGATVVAVEIDRNLASLLRQRLASTNFALIEGDALDGKHAINPELTDIIATAKAGGRPIKLVANLPYNIASPLVVELLIAGVDLLAFTVQKEVADRLRGSPGHEDYGPLTVMVQLLADVEYLRTLPPQAFWPPPQIESALVRLRRADRLGERAGPFGRFLSSLFSARRKTLRKAFMMCGYDPIVLNGLMIDGNLRAEELSPQRLLELFLTTETQETKDTR